MNCCTLCRPLDGCMHERVLSPAGKGWQMEMGEAFFEVNRNEQSILSANLTISSNILLVYLFV